MLATIINHYAVTGISKSVDGRQLVKDGVGNTGFISGKVFEQGVPVSRRVTCHHQRTARHIYTTWSDANGDYRFDDLIADIKYFVLAFDENGDSTQYDMVSQSLIPAGRI